MGDRLGIRDVVDTFYCLLSIAEKESKTFAPGEARTHGLQIMRLTRCLLRYGGSVMQEPSELIHTATICGVQEKSMCTHGGTRTPNLRFRRPTPYPLGHAGTVGYTGLQSEHMDGESDLTVKSCVARESNPGRKNGNLA